MHTVPSQFQPLMPSVAVDKLNVEQDKDFVIEALIKQATGVAWRWMLQTYNHDDIAHVVKKSKNLSKKDVMLWSHYLGIDEKEIACLQTKFPSGLKNSWAY